MIHFELLLWESILDSNGHALWKKYNLIILLWIIIHSLYLPLSTNTFTHCILIGV